MIDYEERTQFVKRLFEEVKCNTREYVAICVHIKVLQPAKIGGKRSGRGKKSYARSTTQLFKDRCSKCNATRIDGPPAIFFAN